MPTFENKTTIDASPAKVWETLSDIEGIAKWAALITHSPVEGTPGVGAVRKCTLYDGMKIDETIDAWEDQKSFAYNVTGLPVPVRSTWSVAADGDGSEVTYHGNLQTDDAEMGAGLSEKLSGMSQFLLAALKHNIETGEVLAPPAA